jgi:hypothetical protein
VGRAVAATLPLRVGAYEAARAETLGARAAVARGACGGCCGPTLGARRTGSADAGARTALTLGAREGRRAAPGVGLKGRWRPGVPGAIELRLVGAASARANTTGDALGRTVARGASGGTGEGTGEGDL